MFKHCKEQNLSYAQHFLQAIRYSAMLLGAFLACLIHSVLPCLFETTASSIISKMHGEINNV